MSFAQQLVSQLPELHYSALFKENLRAHRDSLSDGVGIDRLLTFAGVSHELYPPTSMEVLNSLIGAIERNRSSRLAQTRAIYYLFLDFSPPTSAAAGSATLTAAQYYARQLQFDENEQNFVRSIWLLDHGHADQALPGLGSDWVVESPELINEYIVYVLSSQSPAMVAAFLAARGTPGDFVPELVQSLANRGKFHEVLTISRGFQAPRFLEELGPHAVRSKPLALELAQLPCTPDEWGRVLAGLSAVNDPLVNTIQLVRALHLGDNKTLQQMKGTPDTDVFIKYVLPAQ